MFSLCRHSDIFFSLLYSNHLSKTECHSPGMKIPYLITSFFFFLFAHSEVRAELIYGFPYSQCFEQAATKYGLDATFIAAVASVESGLDPMAVSSADALGLMQIKWPLTAKELNIYKREDLFDPCVNIDAGARYLAQLNQRFASSLLALAAYHVGPTRVDDTKLVPARALNYIEKILKEERLIKATEQLSEQVTYRCDPLNLKRLGLTTHDPRKRKFDALEWLNEHQSVCSISQLIFIKNRVQVWFGTSDSDGAISDKVVAAISRRNSRP